MRRNAIFLAAAVALVFVQLITKIEIWSNPLSPFGFQDPDVWFRLVRVWQLHDTGEWYNRMISRWDAPYGLENHWTRPLDVFLLALAWPASLFVPYKQALLFAMVACNAVLWLVSAVGAMVLCRVLAVRSAGMWMCIILIFFWMDIAFVLQIGRPDHHGLLLALFIWILALIVRFDKDGMLRHIHIAGGLTGLSMWISPESIATIAMIALVMGAGWIFFNDTRRLYALCRFMLIVWAICVGALFLEWPPERLLTLTYIRLSIVHVHVLGVVFLTVALLSACAPRLGSWQSRFALSALAGMLALAWIYHFYPRLHEGPMADTPPDIIPAFLISWFELRSMAQVYGEMGGMLILAVFMLPIAVYLSRLRYNGYDASTALLLLASVVYTGLSVHMFRWGCYAAVACLPGWAMLADSFQTWLERRFPALVKQSPRLAGTLSVVLLISLHTLSYMLAGLHGKALRAEVASTSNCLTRLVKFIERDGISQATAGRSELVLTYADQAGQVLFWTPHKVVASNYNYNERGLRDLDRFFFAQDEKEAFALAQERGAGLVLLCNNLAMRPFFPENSGRLPLFIDQLYAGNLPAWLERVPGDYPNDLLFLRIKSATK